jgi:hypothetical protein
VIVPPCSVGMPAYRRVVGAGIAIALAVSSVAQERRAVVPCLPGGHSDWSPLRAQTAVALAQAAARLQDRPMRECSGMSLEAVHPESGSNRIGRMRHAARLREWFRNDR